MTIPIICPHDGAVLSAQDQTLYRYLVCWRDYPVEGGVLRLLDNNDEFYEGAYENQVGFIPRSERPRHVWPLWLINSSYPWAVRRFVSEGSMVVELGCEGGVKYFGQRYHMVGCDLSLSSLKKLVNDYECCVQADAALCIPLPDDSVDAVVSSYFWEHIPPDLKPRILSECRRILKPGGKAIFLYDVDTENPLIRHYKQRDLALYNSLFIEEDGHLGYQRPRENLDLFQSAGFRVIEHVGMEKTWLQSPSVYTKLAEFGPWARRFFSWTRLLSQAPWFYLYTALMRVTDTVICHWLPQGWARIDQVVLEKEGM